MSSTELITLSDNVARATNVFYGKAAEMINDSLLKKGMKRERAEGEKEYVIDLTEAHFNVYREVFTCPEDEEGQSPLQISSDGDPTNVCFTGEWGDSDLCELQRSSVIGIVRWLEQYTPGESPQLDLPTESSQKSQLPSFPTFDLRPST